MDKLETAKLKKLEKVETGSVAASVFSEDGALYRVTVLGVDGSGAEVRYCDYGNMEKKGVGELFKVADDLAKHEQLAARVRVEGVKGVADSTKNRARVEKKLSVEGLMVKVVEDKDGLVGSFEVGGKKLKFSKNKESGSTEDPKVEAKSEKNEQKLESKVVDERSVEVDETVESKKESPKEKVVADVEKSSTASNAVVNEVKGNEMVSEDGLAEDATVTALKVPVSTGKLVLYSQLPNLKLLEGVEISGTVVYVSPLGGVWFCPQWIQVSLDTMTVKVDALDAEGKLEKMKTKSLVEGLLCISRSVQDGELYRARVVTVDKKVTVSYIDFGNTEVVSVDDVYELPSGLEMMAPASAEVMLARDLPKQKTQEVLEATLMEVENLVLVLEKDKTGARVGKFYIDGKEVEWDSMVESKKVYEKDRVDSENNEDEEDVVIESEIDVKEDLKKECSAKENLYVKPIPEIVKEKKPEIVKKPEPENVGKKPEVVTKPEPGNVRKKPEVVTKPEPGNVRKKPEP